MSIQAKVLRSITLTRVVPHVANVGAATFVNRFRVGGLHPRLWVKAGMFWVPGADGLWPYQNYAYGWAAFLQAGFSTGGENESGGNILSLVDPPIWGTEAAPIAMATQPTTDGRMAATVGTTIGNPNPIPNVTRYARAPIGKIIEVQSAATELEMGVLASASASSAYVGGQWKGFAACYPAGPMSDCEWKDLSARFDYTSVPPVVDLENAAD